ncbi:MAG: trehalose-phosphatase [Bdellovibrionota bacterium]
MKYLFSEEGLSELALTSSQSCLLAFDFDGTLAPITGIPSQAQLNKDTQTLLHRLALLYPVAVVSGRGVADLTGRLPLGLHSYIGNHGIEGLESARKNYASAEKVCAAWHFALTGLFASHGFDDIFLENKRLSLAVHYRNSRQPVKRRRDILTLCALLVPPPRVLPGKFVINLIPPELPNKGDALQELIKAAKAKTAIYVGDDDTDEDVFRLKLPNVLSVLVGRRKVSDANFYLKDQTETQHLLEVLLRLRKAQSS